jgi:hypothetical protein
MKFIEFAPNESNILAFSDLDSVVSAEDKLVIFEEFYRTGNLTESTDQDTRDYFESLTELSDVPIKNQKYITVPMILASNKPRALDKPSYLKFLGLDKDGWMLFGSDNGTKTYPPKTLREVSIFNTFTFSTAQSYDIFRTTLILRFDVSLPNIDLNK